MLSFGAESLVINLVSKNLKPDIYRTVILPVLYGYETWSFTMREEYMMNIFEKRVLRMIFGTIRDEVTGGGEDCVTRSFILCTYHQK